MEIRSYASFLYLDRKSFRIFFVNLIFKLDSEITVIFKTKISVNANKHSIISKDKDMKGFNGTLFIAKSFLS